MCTVGIILLLCTLLSPFFSLYSPSSFPSSSSSSSTYPSRKYKTGCHTPQFSFPLSSSFSCPLILIAYENRNLGLPFLNFSSPLILISHKNRKTVPIFLSPLLILTLPPLFIFLSLTRIEIDSSSLSFLLLFSSPLSYPLLEYKSSGYTHTYTYTYILPFPSFIFLILNPLGENERTVTQGRKPQARDTR